MAPKKKKTDAWISSEGRKLLFGDVKDERIPADMDWKTAYALRPEFAVGKTPEDAYRLFESRLKSVRETVAKRNARAAEELHMLQQDRILHPAPPFDSKGLPRWQGSESQRLLLLDINRDKKLNSMTREQLIQSRLEYHTVYPKQYMLDKIEQMVKTNKFLKQMRTKKGHGDLVDG